MSWLLIGGLEVKQGDTLVAYPHLWWHLAHDH